MTQLSRLFLKRIGLKEDEAVTFENLDRILAHTARSIPFENLRLLENNLKEITKENLTNKILIENEGGLCYELNPLLYLFLKENGFDVTLYRAVVFNQEQQRYQSVGRTHVTILLTYEGQAYVVDTGFGANLPLKPVPLTGEIVTSDNGQFRVRQEANPHGDHLFEMKLKHKHDDWTIGYAFDSKRPVAHFNEFNEIQQIIAHHPESPFNKRPLLTRLTWEGNITLTDSSFTQWIHGDVSKEEVDQARFKVLAKEHFGLS